MNPRLQKLALDWKTYVALAAAAGALLSALTDMVRKAAETVSAFKDLPPEARWVVAAIFASLTIVFLVAALSRRSVLLEPKRFLLSSENPEHLVGREEEVEHLSRQCRRHSLVFLVGDSGSGKSALVRAGLAYGLTTQKDSALAGYDFVPLVLDLSGVGWQSGLAVALARGLGRLPEDAWKALGGGHRPPSQMVLHWLQSRPAHAPWRLLLILDQFDDYLAVHRSQFYDGTSLRRSGDIEARSTDWQGLAEALRNGSLCVLVVARSEAGGSLPALCFVEEAAIAREHLTRLPGNLVAPLIDRLTEPVEGRPVVSEPEFGWLQLRSRLLRDLEASGEGQILPIQLAVALNSLRLSRYLTPAEYEQRGGLRGLERLHVERHAGKAAAAGGVPIGAVLEALLTMVSPDGAKTRPVSRADVEGALARSGATSEAAGRAIFQLEDDKLLRRASGEGTEGETLLLYHDYLARGVREAHRQANQWTELLRERAQLFQGAIGWRQRWRALLSPAQQTRLFWERIRGRFSFKEKRGFVGLSSLRWLPIALALAFVAMGGWQADRYRKNQIAAEVVQAIGHQEALTEEEAGQLLRLKAAGSGAITHALQLAARDSATAGRASKRVNHLVALAVGLDPDEKRSEALVKAMVGPTLENMYTGSKCASFTAAIASKLRPSSSLASQIAEFITLRMKTEPDSGTLADLGEALGSLSGKLDRQDVVPGAEALIARMETERSYPDLVRLGKALSSLTAKLERQDAALSVAGLVARMKVEPDGDTLKVLGEALASLNVNLDRQNVAPGAAVLIARARTGVKGLDLMDLSETLGLLGAKLERQDVAPLAAYLVEEINSTSSGGDLWFLGSSLDSLPKLERHDIVPAAASLAAWMEANTDDNSFVDLSSVLGSLSAKLERRDVAPLAAALVARMVSEPDSRRLFLLGLALGAIREKLERQDVAPGAVALVLRMKTETQRDVLGDLKNALRLIIVKLERQDVAPLAAALVTRMKSESDRDVQYELRSSLALFCEKLERQDAAPLAVELIAQMKAETNSKNLADLGLALGLLSTTLERQDVAPGAAALVERMKSETNSDALGDLGLALGSFSAKLERKDIVSGATALVARIKVEDSIYDVSKLGSALGALRAKLERKDVAAGAAELAARMKSETDNDAFVQLGSVLGAVSAVPAFEMLLVKTGREWNEEALTSLSRSLVAVTPALPNPVSLSVYRHPVRLEQVYVDLLKSPFMVGDARAELLGGLEQVTGQPFSGNLWAFVDWATQTDAGRALKLDLEGPPPWSTEIE